ncbi:MAG: hypothetical protein GY898_22590 [Proteobacteria bacterium]|nr:hypothetical protein [Pseudomonadota bacterium]
MKRSSLVVAALLGLLFASSASAADYRARAHKAHPDESVALDGLLAEMTLLTMMVRTCEGEVCDELMSGAEEMKTSMAQLWRYVSSPEGKRDPIDSVFRDVEGHAMAIDNYMPRSDLPDVDALMREWAGTRERVARFHRAMRQQSGEGATASSR